MKNKQTNKQETRITGEKWRKMFCKYSCFYTSYHVTILAISNPYAQIWSTLRFEPKCLNHTIIIIFFFLQKWYEMIFNLHINFFSKMMHFSLNQTNAKSRIQVPYLELLILRVRQIRIKSLKKTNKQTNKKLKILLKCRIYILRPHSCQKWKKQSWFLTCPYHNICSAKTAGLSLSYIILLKLRF